MKHIKRIRERIPNKGLLEDWTNGVNTMLDDLAENQERLEARIEELEVEKDLDRKELDDLKKDYIEWMRGKIK